MPKDAALAEVNDPRRWYGGEEAAVRLGRLALELVSTDPRCVQVICRSLIRVLAEGTDNPEGSHLRIGRQVFQTRSELRARCQQILRQYDEGAHLDEGDARFMVELLAFHPRGPEKLAGWQAVSIGRHPVFARRCFCVVREEGREDFSFIRCLENAPTSEELTQDAACDTLLSILRLHPAACEAVAQLVDEKFPEPYKGQQRHRNWTRSILRLCGRTPALTDYLLRVLVRRLVQIDVQIVKMEDEDVEEETGDEGGTGRAQLDHMAQILDDAMLLFFEFLQRNLAGGTQVDQNSLVSTMFGIFASQLLLTHQTRCVQFLWFYLASLRPAWCEGFLTLLLQTLWVRSAPLMKRMIAVAYAASFIARALDLTPGFMLATATYISRFARELLPEAEHQARAGELKNPQFVLFLSTVQALCYMLCFHAAAFSEASSDTADLDALSALLPNPQEAAPDSFRPVLDSTCAPMAHIARKVAKEFAKRIEPHRPACAQAVRQQLAAASLARADCCCGELDGVDDFYPFDPYRLRHSSMFLQGRYRLYEREADDTDTDGEEEPSGGFRDTASGAADAPAASAAQQAPPLYAAGDPESSSDVDFTDATPAAARGFVPSVKPSPAFRPRDGGAGPDSLPCSPLVTPFLQAMECDCVDAEDDFALPGANVDAHPEGASLLTSLMRTAAYSVGPQ